MTGVKITLSPRLRAMFDRRELDDTFKGIGSATAAFLLGKPFKGQKIGRDSILKRGFKKWQGRQNRTTRMYDDYSEKYEQWKDEQGHRNWHVVSGNLYKDAILSPKIEASRDGFTITVAEGKSSKYKVAQQYGTKAKPKIPARPYYYIDKKDITPIATFIEKRLIQAFGSEARTGTI